MKPNELAALGTPVRTDEKLSSLLRNWVDRVTGVTHAVLVAPDGLTMTASGPTQDQEAAWAASFGSLAGSAHHISGAEPGGFRQAFLEYDTYLVFMVVAEHEAVVEPGTGPRLVSSKLCVLAEKTADPDLVGFQMSQLVKSVAGHLGIAVRSGPADGGR